MSESAVHSGAAIGVDHVGIAGADLDALAEQFVGLGFQVTPRAVHASGRTANRCVMLRGGGYLELIAKVPGQESATLDRFLMRGAGAHILALEITDEAAAVARLARAGVACDASVTERDAGADGARARFAVIMPPDPPEGRWLLIRQLTRELLWRPDNVVHPNGATALTEVIYASGKPAETMSMLSRISGRPAEPDPLGYRITFARGRVRILPRQSAAGLFPGAQSAAPILGLTIATEGANSEVVMAGGVAIRLAGS